MFHICYTVFIYHVGALPESEPVTLFRLADVKDYLRSIWDDLEASETRFTVITPLHQITRKALMSSEMIYLQTEQLYLMSVRLEQFDSLPDDEIGPSSAKGGELYAKEILSENGRFKDCFSQAKTTDMMTRIVILIGFSVNFYVTSQKVVLLNRAGGNRNAPGQTSP